MPFALLVTAFVVLGVIAVVAAGRGDGLVPEDAGRHRSPFGLPPSGARLVAADLSQLRFAVVFRGYRADEVDAVLNRLAVELAERDARIDELTDRARCVPADSVSVDSGPADSVSVDSRPAGSVSVDSGAAGSPAGSVPTGCEPTGSQPTGSLPTDRPRKDSDGAGLGPPRSGPPRSGPPRSPGAPSEPPDRA